MHILRSCWRSGTHKSRKLDRETQTVPVKFHRPHARRRERTVALPVPAVRPVNVNRRDTQSVSRMQMALLQMKDGAIIGTVNRGTKRCERGKERWLIL